jgi:predicted ATPase
MLARRCRLATSNVERAIAGARLVSIRSLESRNRHMEGFCQVRSGVYPASRAIHLSAVARWTSEQKTGGGQSQISPIKRYDELVERGLLREDSHQRQVVQRLEDLHEKLKTYEQEVHPEPETKKAVVSIFTRFFGGSPPPKQSQDEHDKLKIPESVPKGLYLYGDVGTGKR